ncbi:ABC transporter ATP-binding protein [Duganella sp. BuS-21]|uniref:ABC transporter ATP-binding protein n=1 Tax=Duganella sp. BuS-21 TaxID=2943848 RepID=UPI0035A60171
MKPSDDSDNLVELHDLNFAYGKRVILSGVNMTFPRGKVVAIMGGSGSGKTTILRLIGGLLTPMSGQIIVDGEVLDPGNTTRLYAMRRKMGMLFQQGALFTDLTVFENVAYPLREHTKLPEDLLRDMVLLKLNAVGLRNAAKMKPGEISGGMARRVALARTIALDPALIMYDEPYAGLDPISKGVIANLIRSLNGALGSTSIMVSHDVEQSLAMADYIYFLSQGKVVAQGTPKQMVESLDPYVKQFIHAEADGPVPFQYPGKSLAEDMGFAVQGMRSAATEAEASKTAMNS